MATDPRDPRFLDRLRQLENNDQVTGGGRPAASQPRTEPNLRYNLSGVLDTRPVDFPALNGRMIFYHPAKGIVIPDRIKGPLNDIAEDFFYRTNTPLFINSGRRDPVRQAAAMYRKFKNNVRGDYAGRPLGDEIIGIYDHAVAGRYDERQTINAMAHTIQQQVDRRQYVSQHLRDNAVDIMWQDSPARRNALIDIVNRRGHILKNEGYPLHHHLSFRIGR